MPVIFHNTNGDTGTSEAASVKPIVNADPIAPAVTNRPTENLRLRTDVLRYSASVQDLALASPLIVCSESTTGLSADVYWEGPFDPTTGTIPADVTTGAAPNTGKFWLGSRGATGSYQLRFYPANSPLATRFANVSYTYPSSLTVKVTTSATAANGGNSMRVRILGDLSSGTATAAWEGDDIMMAVQAAPAASGVPALPTTRKGTLVIHVRSNGSTKVSDIQTVLAATPSPVQGVTYTISSPAPTTDLVPANDTGYLRLGGGVDAISRTLSAATIGTFFDTNKIQTTLAQVVTLGASPQQVSVASTTGISVGAELYIDSGANAEAVIVTAVQASPAKITAVFTKNHASGVAIIAAPNRLRKGDTLVALLGNAHARLQTNSALAVSDLAIIRANTSIQQDTYIVPLFSVSASGTRVIFNSVHSIEAGSVLKYTTLAVELGGDLLGPGSTAQAPVVKRATNTVAGVVVLNAPTQFGDAVGHVATVRVDGTVIGSGLGTVANSGTLTIAGLAAETLDMGHASSTARIRSTTTFDLGVKLPGVDTAAVGTLSVGTTTATQVNVASSSATTQLQGPVKVYSTVDRIAAGDLGFGNTTATSVTVSKAGVATYVKGPLKVAADIDRETAGALTIGASTATEVDIGKASGLTSVKGQLAIADYTTAVSLNAGFPAIAATGNGAGIGLSGTGGASNGVGVVGTGGATNGVGVQGTGTGTGTGVKGTGGATNAVGVTGVGGGTTGVGVAGTGASGGNAAGVAGTGTGTGSGVAGVGGVSNGPGVTGNGTGTGSGVTGTGGSGGAGAHGVVGYGAQLGTGVIGYSGAAAGATGVYGEGTSAGAIGVWGKGNTAAPGVFGRGNGTNSAGVSGTGGTNSAGVTGVGDVIGSGVLGQGGTSGVGVEAIAGGATPVRGAVRLTPQTAPTAPLDGDVWVDTAGKMYYRGAGSSKQVNTTPEEQTYAAYNMLAGRRMFTGASAQGPFSFTTYVPNQLVIFGVTMLGAVMQGVSYGFLDGSTSGAPALAVTGGWLDGSSTLQQTFTATWYKSVLNPGTYTFYWLNPGVASTGLAADVMGVIF